MSLQLQVGACLRLTERWVQGVWLRMQNRLPPSILGAILGCSLAVFVFDAGAQVRINEIAAATSERVLQFADDRTPRVGSGEAWQAISFDASSWNEGPGPLGWDERTNTKAAMNGITPSLYVRREFSVTSASAGSLGDLLLDIDFEDGYVAYLNGIEVARRNLGPSKGFVAFDRLAYNEEPTTTGSAKQITNLGAASSRLLVGTNVLAIQVHAFQINRSCSIGATLSIVVGTTILCQAILGAILSESPSPRVACLISSLPRLKVKCLIRIG